MTYKQDLNESEIKKQGYKWICLDCNLLIKDKHHLIRHSFTCKKEVLR